MGFEFLIILVSRMGSAVPKVSLARVLLLLCSIQLVLTQHLVRPAQIQLLEKVTFLVTPSHLFSA